MDLGVKQKLHSFNDHVIQPTCKYYIKNIHPTVKIVVEKIIKIAKILLIIGMSCALFYAHPTFAFFALALGIVAPNVVMTAQENLKRVWNGKIWGEKSSTMDQTSPQETTKKTNRLWMLNRALIVTGLGFCYLVNLVPATISLTVLWFATLGAKLHHPEEQQQRVSGSEIIKV